MSVQRKLLLALQPPFFFVAYITLANTFLAITHAPLDANLRHEFATVYMEYLSVFLFHTVMQMRPDMLHFIQMLVPKITDKSRVASEFVVSDGSSSELSD